MQYVYRLSLLANIFAVSLGLYAQEISFEGGKVQDLLLLSAKVNIRCLDGHFPSSQDITCAGEYLKQGNQQNLILQDHSITKVVIQRIGRYEKKIIPIKKGTSLRPISLWKQKAQQQNFLDKGENILVYKMYRHNEFIKNGKFKVLIQTINHPYCPYGHLFYQEQQCPEHKKICLDYFKRYKYCQ